MYIHVHTAYFCIHVCTCVYMYMFIFSLYVHVSQADEERKHIIKNGRRCGNEAAAEAFGVTDSCDISMYM